MFGKVYFSRNMYFNVAIISHRKGISVYLLFVIAYRLASQIGNEAPQSQKTAV